MDEIRSSAAIVAEQLLRTCSHAPQPRTFAVASTGQPPALEPYIFIINFHLKIKSSLQKIGMGIRVRVPCRGTFWKPDIWHKTNSVEIYRFLSYFCPVLHLTIKNKLWRDDDSKKKTRRCPRNSGTLQFDVVSTMGCGRKIEFL